MRKIPFLLAFGAALCFAGCAKKVEASSFKNMIIGNWMAVGEDDMQIAPEWGFFYEASIRLYADNSFAVNVPAADDTATFRLGNWKLKDNNSSIIFYTVLNDSGTIKRDTTEFKISINSAGNLILQNDQNLIRHVRIK